MDDNDAGDPTPPPPSLPPAPGVNPQSGTQSVGAVGTTIVVFGILGWIAIGILVGVVISFGACFKQECSTLEGGAPLWAGLLALVLMIPSITALFRKRLTPVHVVLCAIPLALALVLFVLGVVSSI